jgi:hypothetical protein
MSAQRSRTVIRPLAELAALATALVLTGCGGGSTATPAQNTPSISVSISQTSATVPAGQPQSLTATVAQDSQNKGVTWTLSGPGCSGNTCGTLSAASSPSGTAITYTAPNTPPTPPTVTLTATSVSDGTKSSSVTITIAPPPPAIAVTVSPPTPNVQVNATQTLAATLQNDSQNKGVNWTLSLAGAACTADTCGSVAPTMSTSGGSVTYTAPASVPAGAVALTATSIADSTKSAAAIITVTPPKIAVMVIPPTASLATGGVTQTFTADLQNDSQNKGAIWTLSGANCTGATCGTVSPASSLSGAIATYTSPPSAVSVGTVLLTATSVANSTATSAATITLVAPAVPTPSTPLDLGEAGVDLGFGEPVIATDPAGNIDVAWINNGGPEFVRSTNGGTTFSTAITIPSNMQDTVSGNGIQMGVDGNGNINLLWHRELTPTGTILNSFFSRSADGGATFSTPVNPGGATSAQLAVAPNGNIAILWFDETTSNLLAVNSSDGVRFSSPITVSTAIASTHVMDLTAVPGSPNQIYIFWTQVVTMTSCSILSSSSLDGGATFSATSRISGGAGSCNQTPSATADSSGNVDVAWDADGSTVFFSRSTNSGATFSPPVNVLTTTSPSSPSIDAGPGATIFVVVDSASSPALSRSMDAGATFSAASPPPALGALLGIDSCSNVTLVGQGNQGIIEYQRSMDGGATFANPVTVSDILFNVEEQFALAKSGNVHIVWAVDGPPEIEYVRVPTTCRLP